MTRADQLKAKNKKKDEDGLDETKPENGDEPQPKSKSRGRPKAKSSPKQKAKARAKAKAKTTAKAKTKAAPKRKSGAPHKRNSKETEDADDGEEHDHDVKATKKKAETAPVPRKLFNSESEQEHGEEEEPEMDPEIDEVPPVLKRPASKRAPEAKSGASQTSKMEEKIAAAKRKPAKRNKKEEQKEEQKDEQEVETDKEKMEGTKKKRARRSVVAPQPENMESLRDPAMKGIIAQYIKEVKNMTYDDMKEHLESKKKGMDTTYARQNVYWHSCRSACSMLLNRKKPFDAYSFAFKNGTWNSRMAAAFACTWLGATR